MVVDYYAADDITRENIVEPLISKLRMFGITVFDECQEIIEEGGTLLLRETDYYAMTTALANQKYVVCIVTKECFGDISLLVELDIISKLNRLGKIKVFTIFDGVESQDLPERVKWLGSTYVLNVKNVSDTHWAALVIAEKYWYDKVLDDGVNVNLDEPDVLGYLENSCVRDDAFVKELLDIYMRLDRHNYSRCMVVLIVLNRYLSVKYNGLDLKKENKQCINRIAEVLYGARPLGKREMNILCCCIIDLLEGIRRLK